MTQHVKDPVLFGGYALKTPVSASLDEMAEYNIEYILYFD